MADAGQWAAMPNADAHPRQYNGPLPAMHVADGRGYAACNRRLMLDDTLVFELTEVGYLDRCRRSGCRQQYIKADGSKRDAKPAARERVAELAEHAEEER